jgi:hypothetical protein
MVYRKAEAEDKDERNEWKDTKGTDNINVTRASVNNVNRQTHCST